MSVINQMLVDLEQRRASGAERNRIPDHVRALPGETGGKQISAPVIAGVLAAAALAIGAWWWLSARTPAMPPPPAVPAAAPAAAALAAEQEAVEMIARRMSFELAYVPETTMSAPEAAPVAMASVIAPAAPSSPPAPVKTRAAQAAPVPVADTPLKKRASAAPPPPVEIEKRVRALTPRQRADIEYAKGATALHQGRTEEARIAFEAVLEIDPAYHQARQALIGLLLNARQPAEVSRLLEDGVRIAPAQYGFAMTLARLQMERGELDVATQTLARSLEYAGAIPEYIAFYAGLLQRQQKHAEAVVQFQRALQLRNDSGVWLLGIGVSLDALGRRADAQEAYRRAQATGNLSADLQAFAEQRLR